LFRSADLLVFVGVDFVFAAVMRLLCLMR